MREIGIEDARKILGELVDEAAAGADVLLTRHRRPIARLTRFQEDTVTTTTTTYGAQFGVQEQMDGILAYINGGDYGEADGQALAAALFAALDAEVNEALPADVFWTPSTSEFVHPVGAEIPDQEEMSELFKAAWQAVEAQFDEIEAAAIGS